MVGVGGEDTTLRSTFRWRWALICQSRDSSTDSSTDSGSIARPNEILQRILHPASSDENIFWYLTRKYWLVLVPPSPLLAATKGDGNPELPAWTPPLSKIQYSLGLCWPQFLRISGRLLRLYFTTTPPSHCQRIMSSSPTKRSPAKATGTRQRARKERIAPVSTPHPPYAFGALLTLGSLTILLPVVSLATLASKLALHPLYGSTTTSLHFVEVLAGTCALATTRPDLPVHTTLLALGTLLSAAPFTARWLGSWTARWHDPIWGPVVTQMGIAVPVVGLSVVLARSRVVSTSFQIISDS